MSMFVNIVHYNRMSSVSETKKVSKRERHEVKPTKDNDTEVQVTRKGNIN